MVGAVDTHGEVGFGAQGPVSIADFAHALCFVQVCTHANLNASMWSMPQCDHSEVLVALGAAMLAALAMLKIC